MKKWTATRFEPDGAYAETVEALSREQAARICDERGWLLEGELHAVVTGITDEQADEMIQALNDRDRSVLQ